jgi:hypothetical protein
MIEGDNGTTLFSVHTGPEVFSKISELATIVLLTALDWEFGFVG